jgi:hypothetical protein
LDNCRHAAVICRPIAIDVRNNRSAAAHGKRREADVIQKTEFMSA